MRSIRASAPCSCLYVRSSSEIGACQRNDTGSPSTSNTNSRCDRINGSRKNAFFHGVPATAECTQATE